MHKSLVKYKIFKTEEEAKAAVTSDSSAVCHIGDKYFLAYSPVAEVIREGIASAVDLLKLEVELGFEWQVGSNWAECH